MGERNHKEDVFTGKDLIDLIIATGMDKQAVNLDATEITFAISEFRNPLNEDQVVYVDYTLDLANNTGHFDTF